MSTSLYLKRRDADFGPWYDHYVSPWAECHPNYAAISLRKEGGVKVCVKVANTTASTPSAIGYEKVYRAPNMYGEKEETRLHNNLSRNQRVIPLEVRKYIRESPVDTHKSLGI